MATKNNTSARINKIISLFIESGGDIRPHFFITGPTGAGKTHTIIELADAHNIDVISVNSAQITNEGIAGNSLSKTLAPLRSYQGKPVIVFFDEFDKAVSAEAEVTSGAVQQEVLKILEDDTTEVFGAYGKFDRVQTSNVLFIFAGSFSGAPIKNLSCLLDQNIKPELLGRIGLHFNVERASLDTYKELVKNSLLLSKYCAVMQGVSKEEAVNRITDEMEAQYDNNIIGIRIVNSLIHQYFVNGGFEEITKRIDVKKENKVVRDLFFG